ncbi:hypothetical protein L0Y59_03280 [Candidatus Uhrbacteria bacterium]|nr:hypothetical protein [Candidatus Uhrbacteria bacterium]
MTTHGMPLTHSLFPGTRGLLKDSSILKALEHVAPADVLATYADPIDFLFCEIKTAYRVICRRFYAGTCGALLTLSISTPERIRQWDTLLMGALLLADVIRQQNVSLPWQEYRALVLETADGATV